MLDYFRGDRPWAQLVRLVDGLPAWSQTGRAMADDDELAQYRADKLGPDVPSGPRRITEWTYEDELIATLADLGNAIRTTIIAVNTQKGNPPQFKPARRPLTARDRMDRRAERQTVDDIVALMLPAEAVDTDPST